MEEDKQEREEAEEELEKNRLTDWINVDSKNEMLEAMSDVHGSGANPRLVGDSKALYEGLKDKVY